jgi:DnaK suppressor protein
LSILKKREYVNAGHEAVFIFVKEPAMNEITLQFMAYALRRQRESFFKEFLGVEADLRFIAEDRESELEERAQEERSARVLARLDDRNRHLIEEIDAALQRIAEGTYGTCEKCEREIPVARLHALPAARFCVRCAGANEKRLPIARKEEVPRTGKVSGDDGLLTDNELETGIRERVREDGRIDTQELRVACRRGVVYLDGALPSEAEHRIVVDHLQVEELLWEREDRFREEPPEECLPWTEPSGTEDIMESTEENIDFVPPASPTPEEE